MGSVRKAAETMSRVVFRVVGTGLCMAPGAFATGGCGATCDRNPDEPPVRYTEGHTDRAAGFYESSPIEGPFLHFPAGRTYELIHGLGAVPEVTPWISFDRCPMPRPCDESDDEQSNATIAAGNIAVFEVIDDERIVVRNDTCSEIRLRIYAQVPGGGIGSGADAGP